jgi:endonuclease YncB( thermonuclease family)
MTQHIIRKLAKVMAVIVFVFLFQVSKPFAANMMEGSFIKDKKISAELVYILDGDSFVVDINGRKLQVRLWGIDCPEHNQPGGDDARMFLKSIVNKEQIFLIPKDIDKYGRLVAIAGNSGGVLNEKLVSSGHAWVYTYYCREPVCRRWQNLEAVAKENNLGVWIKDTPVAPWMWKRKK